MNHERKDILMLGWEFPPAFTGGLGVACYNIVKSLGARANVHLVVPFANSPDNLENVEVVGLNRVGEIEDENLGGFPAITLVRVPVELSSYPAFALGKLFKGTKDAEHLFTISTWSDVSTYFQTHNLYGRDILQRTEVYSVAVHELASHKKFDIIHAHDWPTFQAALELKHDTHKPVVLHIHSLETDRAGEKTRNEIFEIEQSAMQEADKIIAVSEYTRQQIITHYGIDKNKVEVVHNGAEEMEHSLFKKKSNEKWVSFIGRVTFQKGPQFLVETASKLIRVYPNVRFIIAGSGDLLPAMMHEVARQRLGKYFSFTGFLAHEKIKDLLASSDAYFMPSVSEPFGLSAIEAAQQGTASVISKYSGAAEVLANSLQADFWDTDKFANYLYAILTYPKLKKAIESRSSKDVTQLTWGKATDKIMNVYSSLMI